MQSSVPRLLLGLFGIPTGTGVAENVQRHITLSDPRGFFNRRFPDSMLPLCPSASWLQLLSTRPREGMSELAEVWAAVERRRSSGFSGIQRVFSMWMLVQIRMF